MLQRNVACLLACVSLAALSNCFILLCFTVSSSWAVTAPAPSSSRWQSQSTGSPLAQWQGVRVTPHWLPAYLQPTTHPTTHLPACLPTWPPSTLCCPHKKRVRERGQWPLYCPLPCLQEQRSLPCLKRSAPSPSCSHSISFPLSTIPLSRPVLSLAPLRAMGKPSCVDSFVPVWVITRGRMKVGVKGGA